MIEMLTKALNPVILIFLVSTMLACGLSLTLAQIFGPFRNFRLAISAAAASYIFVPLTAVVVSRLIGLEEPLRIGLVLLSMAAGAEAGPKLTTNANGNVGFSVGLLVVSLGITIFYIPLMLSLLLPEVHVDRGGLLIKLSLTVALPIIVGLFLKARYEGLADCLVKYMHKISSVFMLLMAVLIIMVNYKEIFRLVGSGAPAAAVICIVVAFMIGYLLGWPDRGIRLAMGFMHGGRNASLALMIASQVFGDKPKVLLMITVTVVLMLLILLPVSLFFGRGVLGDTNGHNGKPNLRNKGDNYEA
jgi:bile acid:Na+ symporter, BASS family